MGGLGVWQWAAERTLGIYSTVRTCVFVDDATLRGPFRSESIMTPLARSPHSTLDSIIISRRRLARCVYTDYLAAMRRL